jgi:hypothetical protein
MTRDDPRDDPLDALRGSDAGGCGACAESIEELVEVQGRLDAVWGELRETLAHPTHVAGEHLVAETLGRRLALRRRSRWLAYAAAGSAAAALLFFVLVLARRSATPEPGPMLGPIGLQLVAPDQRVQAWETFVWRARLPAGGWYEIRILASDGRELARETTEENRWTSASTADWPDEIRWQVRAFDASGALLQVREASCSRSVR